MAMLAMSRRITQLGISRWTDKGGSYRSIQRFFHTEFDWLAIQWRFFELFVYDPKGVYLLVGDETVITKAGKRIEALQFDPAQLFAEDDVAIDGKPISEAEIDRVLECEGIAYGRHKAIIWMIEGYPIYSETLVDT